MGSVGRKSILGRSVTRNPIDQTWLLWDGECGFCRRAVQWLQTRLKNREEFRIVPFQQAPSPPMTDEIRQACHEAVHLVLPDGTVLRGGAASRYLLKQSSWRGIGKAFDWPPMSWLLEPGYGLVARNRSLFSRIFFRVEQGSDEDGEQ